MFTFLLTLLILDSLVLVVVILMQAGQGGGMAAAFGGVSSSASTIFGTRQAGNLLTKASWWGAGIFLFLAFVLSMMSAQSRAPRSILDDLGPSPASQAVPPGPPPIQTIPDGQGAPPPLGDTKSPDGR